MTLIERPDASEYAPYYKGYVNAVPEGKLPDLLRQQREDLVQVLSHLTPSKETFRYEPGKWSIREVVGHIVDTERVFAYRLLHFARGEETPIPGMDQDRFAAAAGYGERSLGRIVDEYAAQRSATITLLDSLDAEAFGRSGIASDVSFTVRALAYIICGHDRHHQNILRERYLG